MKNIGKIKKKIERLLITIFGEVTFFNAMKLWHNISGQKQNITEEMEFPYKIKGHGSGKYYILRLDYPGIGIFDAAREFLLTARWAEDKGYIPMVILAEREAYYSGMAYSEGGNLWEKTFVPYRGGVNEIVSNVEAYGTIVVSPYWLLQHRMKNSEKEIKITDIDWKNYYLSYYTDWNKYCKLQPNIESKYSKAVKELFLNETRTLGVCVREGFGIADEVPQSDMLKINPKEPQLHKVMAVVKQCMQRYNCNAIYLSCQFKETVAQFEKLFPGKVLVYDREMVSLKAYTELYRKEGDKFRQESLYESSMEKIQEDYVGQIYCLSKCTCLIGTYSGGTRAALLMNGGKYENIKIFDLEEWGQ